MKNQNSDISLEKELVFSSLVLDAQFDAVFDSITELVATILDAPVALITFVDEESIWIHSEVGFTQKQILPNRKRFCGTFPKDKEFFQIIDTDLDETHKNHLFLIDGFKAKFYAGARINLPLGEMIGVLCIFDVNQRLLNVRERLLLVRLARVIERILATKSFQKHIC